MSKKPPRSSSARATRRKVARDREKLWTLRAKLLLLEDGGSAARPVVVGSASVIEPSAVDGGCARCENPVRVAEHAARAVDGMRLREVIVNCPACGLRRSIWYRIREEGPN